MKIAEKPVYTGFIGTINYREWLIGQALKNPSLNLNDGAGVVNVDKIIKTVDILLEKLESKCVK